jgi:hypothetical protein
LPFDGLRAVSKVEPSNGRTFKGGKTEYPLLCPPKADPPMAEWERIQERVTQMNNPLSPLSKRDREGI